MVFVIAAVAIGLVAGVAAGGRPRELGHHRIRAVGTLGAAVGLQLVPAIVDLGGTASAVLVLASYALLVGVAGANIKLVGMPVVVVGLLLNTAVIAVNGGMPVRADALRAIGEDQVGELDLGPKRHLEDGSDRLTFLGDVVPVRPLGSVLSFGDLILGAGIADVVFRLVRPRHGRRRTPDAPPGALVELLALPATRPRPHQATSGTPGTPAVTIDLSQAPDDAHAEAAPVPVGAGR